MSYLSAVQYKGIVPMDCKLDTAQHLLVLVLQQVGSTWKGAGSRQQVLD